MRAYRLLLLLYPASFRAEYGEEMCEVFSAKRRDTNPLALWAGAVADVVGNAVRVHADVFRQDARWTLRGFGRAPAFALTAIAICALGIGATTAAFTLLNHVLIRPLPFPQARQLVMLYQRESVHGTPRTEATPPNLRDWRDMNKSFSGMGGYVPARIPISLSGDHEPMPLDAIMIEPEVLSVLRVKPSVGRAFTAEDERDGAEAVVLISDGLATTVFGGREDAVGQTVRLNGQPYAVVGVMVPGFAFPARETDLWMPLGSMPPAAMADRRNHIFNVVARLREGVSVTEARADMDVIARQLEAEYPKENSGVGIDVLAFREVISPQSRTVVIAVFGAALCLTLIACANLAHLLATRAMARQEELAVRVALGAGSERLMRQLMTESFALAVLGGGFGLLLATTAMPLLPLLVPDALPIRAIPQMDWRVLVFTAALTTATTLAFSVGPAMRSSRNADFMTLRTHGSVGPGRQRLRSFLVVGEVAGTLVLLVGTGLLLKAMWRVQAVDPGFHAAGVLTMRTSLPTSAPHTMRQTFHSKVLADIRALPGVSSAGYVSFLPLTFGAGNLPLTVPGRPPGDEFRAHTRFVTPDYFRTVGIPLLSGRDVSEQDQPTATPVSVISRSLASQIWPGQDPLGRVMTMVGVNWTVVGIVGDVAVRGLENQSLPQAYFSSDQLPSLLGFYAPKDLTIRTQGDPYALVPAVRRIVQRANPDQAISDVRPLEELVASQTASRRTHLSVLGSMAAIAFLLAAVGIYGLLSFAVSTRVREVGVRMALGAARGDVMRMFVRQGMMLGAAGIGIGLPLAYAAARAMTALLFGVQPHDPWTFGGATVLAAVMILTGIIRPAIRAASLDPAVTIRGE